MAAAAAASSAAAAYNANAPSVYRQPSLPAAAPAAPVAAAPAAPAEAAPPAPAYNSSAAADLHHGGVGGAAAAGGDPSGAGAAGGAGGGVGRDALAEAFPVGGEGSRKGLGLQWGTGSALAGERESIPRDGSTLDVSWGETGAAVGSGACRC